MSARTGSLIAMWCLSAALAAGCGVNATAPATATALPAVIDVSGVRAKGRLEPVRFAQLAPNTAGQVREVLVKEGEQVMEGQVLARFESKESQTLDTARAGAALEVGNAYQAVRVAQAKFDDYPVPRIFVGITAEQAARTWLEKLDKARSDFTPYRDTSRKTLKPNRVFPSLPRRVLFDTGEYRRMAKEYKKALDIAWANYRKATQWLALDSTLQSAKARLARAQANSDSLQQASLSNSAAGVRAALANAEVRAPFAGTITNLNLKPGELVSAGSPVITIANLSGWVVKTTDLTEIDVVNVTPGEPVSVSFDAIPGATFNGIVQSIGQNYAERQGDIVYTATILLSDSDPAMRWGMTTQVWFGKLP
jgi:multidrug resistance efflux pump